MYFNCSKKIIDFRSKSIDYWNVKDTTKDRWSDYRGSGQNSADQICGTNNLAIKRPISALFYLPFQKCVNKEDLEIIIHEKLVALRRESLKATQFQVDVSAHGHTSKVWIN